MGDVRAFVLAIVAILIGLGLLLGWINYKIDNLKDEISITYVRKENAAAVVRVLEGLIRNLNAMCRDHQKRLDILEANHPDDEIDYDTVDDDGNITEVWFEGKRYVPEDKRDEDTVTFYADNKVVAETARMAKAIKPEECLYIAYKNMGGNDKTEELLKRVEDLNYFYNVGLMSAATYMHRREELMNNDS